MKLQFLPSPLHYHSRLWHTIFSCVQLCGKKKLLVNRIRIKNKVEIEELVQNQIYSGERNHFMKRINRFMERYDILCSKEQRASNIVVSPPDSVPAVHVIPLVSLSHISIEYIACRCKKILAHLSRKCNVLNHTHVLPASSRIFYDLIIDSAILWIPSNKSETPWQQSDMQI